MEDARIEALRDALSALLAEYGGAPDEARERACVEQILEALVHTSHDGESLSPLDVARIRAGKFAASRLSPALYRDPVRLAGLRRALSHWALDLVGHAGCTGSRFGGHDAPKTR